MSRFVSALGPDREPKGLAVKYHKSTRYYSDALAKSRALEIDDSQLTAVIYRLSYDAAEDRFFSWRQGDGKEKDDDDNTDVALAYEIYSAPRVLLLDDEGKRSLNAQINEIQKHSQTVRPGNAGPPK